MIICGTSGVIHLHKNTSEKHQQETVQPAFKYVPVFFPGKGKVYIALWLQSAETFPPLSGPK